MQAHTKHEKLSAEVGTTEWRASQVQTKIPRLWHGHPHLPYRRSFSPARTHAARSSSRWWR